MEKVSDLKRAEGGVEELPKFETTSIHHRHHFISSFGLGIGIIIFFDLLKVSNTEWAYESSKVRNGEETVQHCFELDRWTNVVQSSRLK